MKVKFSITGEAIALHYPLGALTDMLYAAIEMIEGFETRHDVDVLEHLPLEFEIPGHICYKESALSVKIEKAEDTSH